MIRDWRWNLDTLCWRGASVEYIIAWQGSDWSVQNIRTVFPKLYDDIYYILLHDASLLVDLWLVVCPLSFIINDVLHTALNLGPYILHPPHTHTRTHLRRDSRPLVWERLYYGFRALRSHTLWCAVDQRKIVEHGYDLCWRGGSVKLYGTL